MKAIYLDRATTIPVHPQVIKTMTAIMQDTLGNPPNIHGFGRHTHEKLETARQIIVDSLQAKPHEIIFNNGGTEGDNIAILETAFSRQEEGRHLITTAVGHSTVLNTMEYLETKGFSVTYLPVDEKGNLSIEEVKKVLREDTILVSVMYGNNEIGNLIPVKEIGELLADHPIYFHIDAVQAYGNQAIHLEELGIDLSGIFTYKTNGSKGVGFLYKRDGVNIPALFLGGEQEGEWRVDTENLTGIWGMAKAVELLSSEERKTRDSKYKEFQQLILDTLETNEIPYRVGSDLTNKLPHTLNLRLIGEANDLLLMKLNPNGVAISTGPTCTVESIESLHALEAIYGGDTSILKESIHIDFGLGNTEDDIQYFLDQLARAVKK